MDTISTPEIEIAHSVYIEGQFKIAILGDESVGKTSLIQRYCFNRFNPESQMTIGLNFYSIFVRARYHNEYNKYGIHISDS